MLNNDYKDMLRALSDHKVKFMLVGGYAFSAHGHPRGTLDIDFFFEATQENAEALHRALKEFGAPVESMGVSASDFTRDHFIYQVGVQPRRIDFINKIDGVEFSEAYPRSVETDLDGITLRVISLEDLLANKKAAGRPKDLVDVTTIEHMMSQNKKPHE